MWAKTKMSNLSPLVAATGMLLASSLILSPIIFLYYGDEFKMLNSKIILITLLFAFLCSVIAYLLYFEILKRTGVGNLLISTIIIPPSAIFLNSFIGRSN